MADQADEQHFFDRDIAVEPTGDNTYAANFSETWGIAGGTPNGGYLMAIAAKALAETLDHPHPLTVTGHYFKRSGPGPAVVETEQLGRSRSTSTGFARIIQDGVQRTHFTATYTDFDQASGKTVLHAEPPELPAPEDCVGHPFKHDGRPTFHDLIDMRFHPDQMGWAAQTHNGVGEMTGYIGFHDGRDPDLYSVLQFADAVPPAIFNMVGLAGWVPTIELTTHLRNRPRPGLLRFRFTTRMLTRGFFEEDGEIWDSEDRLIADSRQIQKLMIPVDSTD